MKKQIFQNGRSVISHFFMLSVALTLCAHFGASAQSQAIETKSETSSQRIFRQLSYLASDQMQGRFPGTQSDTLAAGYIRNILASYGYIPLGDNGFQPFTIKFGKMGGPQTKLNTFNVIMSLNGPIDTLRESIVIGAHYDHLGMGGQGSGSRKPKDQAVHNGADDNASGMVGVMEIARKLKESKQPLKRNIIIAAFGAEEQGILGSKEFIRNPVSGMGKIVAMFNLDMVGRMGEDRKLEVGGVGTFEGGEAFVQSLPNPHHFNLKLSKDGYGPSDHASFYGSGIPVLYFNTGVHADYHTPEDDVEKIQVDQMSHICDYIYSAVAQIAMADRAPKFQKAGPAEDARPRSGFKVSFGIIPDFSSTDSTGLRADFITEGKPAEKAGMKPGDVIKFINNKEVFTVYDYMARLGELKAGDLVKVKVLRKEELITLEIQL